MTTYKLKDDFVNGVLANNGKPNILFKKGDVIQGEQITRFIFNANTKGINAKPTVVGARVENADGLVFIPLQNVEIITNVSDNVGVAISKNQQNEQLAKVGDVLTAEDKFYETLGIKYHNTHMFGRPSRTKGRLLVLVFLVAGYLAYKKFNK